MLVNLRSRRSVDLVVVVGACKATDTTEAVAAATTPGMVSISNRLCLDWISAVPIGTPFRGTVEHIPTANAVVERLVVDTATTAHKRGRQVSASDKDRSDCGRVAAEDAVHQVALASEEERHR